MTQQPLLPPDDRQPAARRAAGFFTCLAGLVALGVALVLLGRHADPRALWSGGVAAKAVAVVGAAVLGTLVWAFGGFLYRTLTSLPFAVAILTLLLLATILGTLVIQGATPEVYATKYGAGAAAGIQGLGLNDLFHSGWYVGWLALLAVSLLLVPVRRKAWRRPQWGLGLAHLGVVVILAGALVGSLWGLKGHLDLHEGRSADAVLVDRGPGQPPAARPFGFALRLEDFDIEFYPPEHKFYVYERSGTSFRARKTVPRKSADAWTSLGAAGIEIRVLQEIPGSRQPAESHVLRVQQETGAPVEEVAVKPDAAVPVGGGAWTVRVLGYYPDFVIDSETRKPSTRSPHPNNPALQIEVSPAGGGPGEKRWLFARMPEFDHGDGAVRPGPRLTYRYVPAETPAQVEIGLRQGAREWRHRFDAQDGDPLELPDGASVLTYELKSEVKAYRSRLAVLEGDRKVLEKTIRVNDPLSYGGFVFYQSNYRKEDLSYSGIQVVRDPGLPLVWGGFLMLCVGAIVICYLRTRQVAAAAGEAS